MDDQQLAFAPDQKIEKITDHKLDVEKTVSDYLLQNGWKANVNSNSSYSFSGLVLHTAGSVIANYVLNQVYPEAVSQFASFGFWQPALSGRFPASQAF
jgi:hypothetical protein